MLICSSVNLLFFIDGFSQPPQEATGWTQKVSINASARGPGNGDQSPRVGQIISACNSMPWLLELACSFSTKTELGLPAEKGDHEDVKACTSLDDLVDSACATFNDPRAMQFEIRSEGRIAI